MSHRLEVREIPGMSSARDLIARYVKEQRALRNRNMEAWARKMDNKALTDMIDRKHARCYAALELARRTGEQYATMRKVK